MKDLVGNIFEKHCDAICITSCGYVRLDGEVYVEHGVQKAAAKKWPLYRKKLGHMILMHGAHVFMLTGRAKKLGGIKLPYHVVNFPTKPSGGVSDVRNVAKQFRSTFKEGTPVPGWAMRTSMALLKQSAREIKSLAKARGWKKVYIQRPDGIKWGVAKSILDKILGKQFRVIKAEEVIAKKKKVVSNEEPPARRKKIRLRRRRQKRGRG